MKEAINLIENLNIKNNIVVAAISGGPDSMYLIELLLSLKEKLNLTIIVAHVHHNLRKESDLEALELEKYCKNNNLEFEFKKIENYPNNRFSEDAARKIRYDFFESVIKKYDADTLFTAHHGDDLIETILMRISRGSTLKGYAGFPIVSYRKGYKIVRPLIYMTKEEMLAELDEKNIWYAQDMSNNSLKYTRNRYRKKIIPELKNENSNINQSFLNFSKKILLADDYLRAVAKSYLNDDYINIGLFNELDEVIKVYVLEEFLGLIYKDDITSITDKHKNLILENLSNKKNLVFDLPKNKKGLIEYNKFVICDDIKTENYEYIFTDKVELPNGKKIIIDNSTKLTTNYVIHLNSKEIKLPFHVRNKHDGDYMIIKNMINKRKVSDIFTDCKLSKLERIGYPIVTDDTGEIIWIPGIKKSHLDRKKEEKYDIILKYD